MQICHRRRLSADLTCCTVFTCSSIQVQLEQDSIPRPIWLPCFMKFLYNKFFIPFPEKNSLLVNCTIQCFKISPDRGHKMANYEYTLQDLETNINWFRSEDTAISPERTWVQPEAFCPKSFSNK